MTNVQAITTSHRNPADDKSSGVDRTCASLCIHSYSHSAEEITELLGISPTRAIKARLGDTRYANRPHGWLLQSEGTVDSKDIRTHLNWLLSIVLPKKDALLRLQHIDGLKMLVRCPWWTNGNDGPVLWPEQMKGLSELNLECAFDFKDYREDPIESDRGI